jgi:electron transfer flavoprotein alpha subunit
VIAVVPVRDGTAPAGGDDAVAEAGGRALLVESAAGFAPGRWARALAPMVAEHDGVVLPASPDGRDLAPRLAAELDRPLYAGAVSVSEDRIDVVRHGGRSIERLAVRGPFVATLQPGPPDRWVTEGPMPPPGDPTLGREVREVVLAGDGDGNDGGDGGRDGGGDGGVHDTETVEVLAPDPSTVDLAEAERVLAGGGGLDGPDRLAQLAAVARAIGASVGASRVVTDRGWVGFDRQIGTTGVAVDPRLYIALAISGAVQHVNGIGTPEHVVAVNTDPYCPMMGLAHVAILCDANALLDELATRLGVADA